MQLFKLMGSIMIDNKDANESLSRSQNLAQKVSDKLGSGVKSAVKWGAGIVAAGTAGVGSLLAVADKSAQTADRIDKLSSKTHLSKQGFQEWDHIMSQSGMSIESLQGGMKKLTGSIDDAITGGKGATEAFSRIGMSADDLKGKSPEQIFENVVKKLQEMPDGAEKAAIANDLLGKSASEMAPILSMTADETESLRKEAHDLGLVMTDELVSAGVVFGDTMANVKDSLGMAFTQVGLEIMPLLQTFADWIIAHMPEIREIMSKVFGYLSQVISELVAGFPGFITAIQPAIGFIKDIATYLMHFRDNGNLTIPIIMGLASAMIFYKGAMAIRSIITGVKNAMTAITLATNGQATAQAILNAVMAANPFAVVAIVIAALVTAGVLLYKNWDKVKATAIDLKNQLMQVWTSLKVGISNAVEGIKSGVSSAFNALKSTVSSIWDGIKSAIERPINSARDIVRNAIDRIKGFFNFRWQWPHIPLPHFSMSGSLNPLSGNFPPRIAVEWYAKGGIFDKPTIFNTPYGFKGVGEAGPEAVTPISKLQEMINWNTGKDTAILERVADLLEMILDKDSNLYINGRRMAKELAGDIDEELQGLRLRRA